MTTETTSPLTYRGSIQFVPRTISTAIAMAACSKTATIPGDQGIYGSFMELRDQAEAAVHEIITEAVQETGFRRRS